MRKENLSSLRVLFRVNPEIGQVFARRALEIANRLPETTINGVIQRGVEEGFLKRVRPRVYKLIGKRGGGLSGL